MLVHVSYLLLSVQTNRRVNSEGQELMLQNAASALGLHCLHGEYVVCYIV